MEILWARLERWQNCIENKITQESYLNLCEQLEQEPVEEDCPPDIEDFPNDVQMAIVTYGKLGDRVVADVGYLGKDWSSLPIHMKYLELSSEQLFVETLLRLDERLIKKSAEEMRQARKRLEAKHGK